MSVGTPPVGIQLHGRIYAAAGPPRLSEIIDGLREPAANYISMNIDLYDQNYSGGGANPTALAVTPPPIAKAPPLA